MEFELTDFGGPLSGLPELRRLLMKIDQLRKQISQIETAWLRRFGNLKVSQLECSVQIVRLRKEIAWIIARQNAGIPVDEQALEEDMERLMSGYVQEMETLCDQVDASRQARPISEAEERRIRRLYRQIARAVHPDLHPELADRADVRELWNQALAAYECNDAVLLENTALEISACLEKGGFLQLDLSEEQIGRRIEKARRQLDALQEDPAFGLQKILNDAKAVKETAEALEKVTAEYKVRIEQLEEEKNRLLKEEEPIWPMN